MAVPTFTMNRSSGEVPSHTPAASPRLRRGHPPWPPEPTTSIPPRSSPPDRRRVRAAIQPIPTGFEPAGDSRGVKHRFLSYTFPSRQPNPNHPVAPARPGVVGAAHHSHRRLPDQAAPSFAMLPRQHSGEGPSPPLGCIAPRGAPDHPPGNRVPRGLRPRRDAR